MIKRRLPDGNMYYYPNRNSGFNSENIDKEINEIYDDKIPHYYEKYYKLNKGMTVVDAGAYTGLFTLKASKAVGPKGIVISMEPFPVAFNILSFNVKKNRCKNVILLNEGLGSKISWEKLIVSNDYIGSSILKQPSSILMKLLLNSFTLYRIIRHQIRLVNVKLTTLNELMRRYNIKKIDFLKMDIEGYEIEAIKSYNKIKKGNVLILETHKNLDKILYLIKEKGYQINETYIVPINGFCSIVHTRF